MTVDERIEKLTERHEALAQSIELMIHENRERDERWDKRANQLDSRLDKLLHIAELQQYRLDSNGDRLDRLEGNA